MIEKLKISRDNNECCAATLIDFWKAFDSIPYDVLIAKLNANGFDQEALKLIHNYLIDHIIHKYLMDSSFSKELDILCCLIQGSIIGPLLSYIDIWDLFFIDMSSDITNYTDDTTPYEYAEQFTKYLVVQV